MVDSSKLGLGCFAGFGVLLLVSIILFANVAYSQGGAVWALLAACALLNLGLALRAPFQAPRKWAAVLAALACALAFAAFLASAVWAAQPEVENGAAGKPFFALVVTVLTGCIAFVNLRPPAGADGEGKVTSYVAPEDGAALGRRDKCKHCCFGCCAVFLLFLVGLASVHSILLASEKVEYEPVEGTLFDIEGHKMFARCAGEPSSLPTVVFAHGLGGNSLDFSWVQRNLSQITRTCGFDRAGYGQSSERGPLPRTSMQIERETKLLLDALAIDEFIYVGHSFAGFNMRIFNSENPGRIQGMVMIDAVNPNSTDACDPNKTYGSPLYEFGLAAAELGVLRLLDVIGFLNAFGIDLLPEDVQHEYKANLNKASYFRTRVDEFAVWGKSCTAVKELSGADKLLDFPLHVIIPEEGIYKDKIEFGEELPLLSPNGTFTLVTDNEATHIPVLFQEKYAKLTILAVLDIMEELN